MDEQLKQNFEQLCHEFGFSLSTAFNIFAKAVVCERRTPF
ncbi:MAG: type II toxin-antitoxin system RelB/DinJ family antitoxin [Alphaproteobacteria bacterium]|nr:type II toxin-antitoxin system RelB/DinJ family antitoxin [Alphaproteobacteria bacterium]